MVHANKITAQRPPQARAMQGGSKMTDKIAGVSSRCWERAEQVRHQRSCRRVSHRPAAKIKLA
jgi:hypothetical protein